MKKIFHSFLFIVMGILLLLNMNLNVSASARDVYIKDVVLAEKSEGTYINGQPNYSGMNINFSLKFYSVNDYVKYKIIIENKGNDDVLISNQGTISEVSNDYINYTFSWGDNDNSIVKANSSKDFYINVTYVKAVDNKDFNESGKFIEDRAITVNLESKPEEVDDNNQNVTPIPDNKVDNTKTPTITNNDNKVNLVPTSPKTGDTIMKYMILLGISLVGIITLIVILIKKKNINLKEIFTLKKNINKYNVALAVIPILLITLVIGYTYALESVEIKINSRVEIETARLAMSCDAVSYKDGFCINWNNYVNYSQYEAETAQMIAIDSKKMEDTYTTEDRTNYKLYKTYDVSEKQNEQVILGVYYNDKGEALLVIGQNGGVNAPIDSSYLFASGCNDSHNIEPLSFNNNFENKVKPLSEEDFEQIENKCDNMKANIMESMHYIDLDKLKVSESNNIRAIFLKNGYIVEDDYLLEISNWDTSKVTNMSWMFYDAGHYATTFELDLSNWNTSNVTDMSGMFYEAGYNAETFELDLSKWDTSNVTNMSGMFYEAGYNAETLDLSKWDTSNVTNMSWMFYDAGCYATTFELDLSKWDTSNVTNMSWMFYGAGYNAETFELDLSKWDTSKVTNMSWMFYDAGCYATTFELDLSNWNTSNVTDMSGMFYYAGYNATTFELDLSNWNISNVTDMSGMFYYAGYNATNSTLELNNFNFDKVSSYDYIFKAMPNNTKIYVKSEKEQTWILNLNSNNRPSSWTIDNVLIAESQ